ncbi:MAG: GLUG motif-containing protein, partial [Phycisphaerales bacterium]
STGNASGISKVGGLVGVNQGTIDNCYSVGSVEGATDVGGLVGSLNAHSFYPDGTVSDSFWDIETSGQTTSNGGTGKTTAEMKRENTFTDSGWDFVEIWGIGENQTYPYLRVYPAGDLNHDGRVDLLDLALLAAHWLQDNSP